MTGLYDVVIIGAGPAGLTAAIYCGRAKLKTLVLERRAVGGQLLIIDTVENYPGFPEGINGFELLERMQRQAQRFEAEFTQAEVSDIEILGPAGFRIATEAKEFCRAKAVIIATGTTPKRLGIKGEEELQGRGISYCATCDGPLFKDKDIIVIGGGDAAVGEAIYLTRFARKVYLIHRRDRLRATKILQERLLVNKKVEVKWDSVATEIIGPNKVLGVKIKNVKTDKELDIAASGVFIFAGTDPNAGFLKSKARLDEGGFVVTDEAMKASVEGLFACGDVRRNALKQIVTSCAEGAQAAYSCYHYIEGLKSSA